jgi:hypothetical protein
MLVSYLLHNYRIERNRDNKSGWGKQEKAEVGLANMAKSLLLLKLDYPAWI